MTSHGFTINPGILYSTGAPERPDGEHAAKGKCDTRAKNKQKREKAKPNTSGHGDPRNHHKTAADQKDGHERSRKPNTRLGQGRSDIG